MNARSAHGQRTLPREYFTSAAIWEAEQERIFRGTWLLAGHCSELQKSGSYLLHETSTESAIVLRDATGELRAFHNFCRHRGTRLCLEKRGQLGATIQCSYHAWTYRLDGSLQGAPHMQDVAGFDKSAWGLKPVALAVWDGFLFVNFADDPQPFAEALPALIGKFEHWPLAEMVSVHQTECEVAANWKLFFHNYSECYHCPTVHPHLNRLTLFRNTANDLDEGPVLGGPMVMSNPDGSMTLHGERCALPFPGLTVEERSRVWYYTLFPSAFLSLHADYVLLHRVRPLAIDRTQVICDWFFHRDAIAVPGFDAQPAIEFWDITNQQDWALCVNAFHGIGSHAWAPGPYSDLESQLAAFDRHYLSRITT